jgi:hypothetical protein
MQRHLLFRRERALDGKQVPLSIVRTQFMAKRKDTED